MANEKILIVEDTELLRRIYTDKLNQEGYTVLQASDGLEALTVIRGEAPDLVLLDLVMPRMSGLEVIDTLKRDPRTRDIPVIILSNLGEDADVKRGLDMGAVDYLVKNSAKPADVSAKIRATIEKLGGAEAPTLHAFRLYVRDHEADADALVQARQMPRRFWCPACEAELQLELLPDPEKAGWCNAHIVCPECGREY